ncbi:MAG: hypothetical protein ABIK77_02555 [candidate division WOR-3 bacterium]|nr:hypothetical protein [Candidatus Omnitrophota bacterium]
MRKIKFIFLLFFIPFLLSAQMQWFLATDSAPWRYVDKHTSVVFDNKMWVIGGDRQDVWYSSDGINWICATESAGFGYRNRHTSVVFDNKIWVIAGERSWCLTRDVWYSSDGINWICATQNAPFRHRAEHTSVVFDNKIWVLGGITCDTLTGEEIVLNDVWYSSDGINWTCATESAGWYPRRSHTSVVFDNKIWIMGGWSYDSVIGETLWNDVWYSSDGINWTCATENAGWYPREDFASIVFNNKIWVIAGATHGWPYKDDVWYSSDGINWVCADESVHWGRPPRLRHTSVVFDNKMWVIGGMLKDDVWYSYGLEVLEEYSHKPKIETKEFNRKKEKIYNIQGVLIKEENLKKGIYFRKTEKDIKKVIILK